MCVHSRNSLTGRLSLPLPPSLPPSPAPAKYHSRYLSSSPPPPPRQRGNQPPPDPLPPLPGNLETKEGARFGSKAQRDRRRPTDRSTDRRDRHPRRFSTRIRVKWLLSPPRRARAYWLASLRLGLHTDRRDLAARVCATAHVLVGAHTRMYTLATECGERRRRRRSRGHVYRTCIHAWGSLLHVHVTHTPHTEFRPRQPRAHVSARRTAERIEGTRFFSFSPLSLSLSSLLLLFFFFSRFSIFPTEEASVSRLGRGEGEAGFDRIDPEWGGSAGGRVSTRVVS